MLHAANQERSHGDWLHGGRQHHPPAGYCRSRAKHPGRTGFCKLAAFLRLFSDRGDTAAPQRCCKVEPQKQEISRTILRNKKTSSQAFCDPDRSVWPSEVQVQTCHCQGLGFKGQRQFKPHVQACNSYTPTPRARCTSASPGPREPWLACTSQQHLLLAEEEDVLGLLQSIGPTRVVRDTLAVSSASKRPARTAQVYRAA